jgi:hypothetical protein
MGLEPTDTSRAVGDQNRVNLDKRASELRSVPSVTLRRRLSIVRLRRSKRRIPYLFLKYERALAAVADAGGSQGRLPGADQNSGDRCFLPIEK